MAKIKFSDRDNGENQKKNFFSALFSSHKDDTQPDTDYTDDDNEESQDENHPTEKYTYTRQTRPVKRKSSFGMSVFTDISKAPFILLLVCMGLSLIGAFLLNADFIYSMKFNTQCLVKTVVSLCIYVIPAVIYMFLRGNSSYNFKGCNVSYTPFVLVSLGLLIFTSALQKYTIAYVYSYRVQVGAPQGSLLMTVLVGALVPAVCEEFLVRGVLQHEFSKYAGGFGGVMFSAIAFTLLHFDLQYFGVYFAAGLILGTVTHVTKSVLPAMVIHFLNNTFTTVLSDRLTFVALERIGGTLLIIVLASLCFILLAIMLQMMEKISMKRAVFYLKGQDETDADTPKKNKKMYSGMAKDEIILFTAPEGMTFRKTLRLFVNPLSLVCYGIFAITVIVALF